MIKPVQTKIHPRYEEQNKVNWEIFTEKPTKKNKNVGEIFYSLNFFDNYQQRWKNSNIKSEKYYRFDQIFKKSININKIDLRDLCLKRGKLLRNIKIKLYLENILKFKDINFSSKFTLGFSQKYLIPRTWGKFVENYVKINEKVKLKGFLRKVQLPKSIRKFWIKNYKISRISMDIIPIFLHNNTSKQNYFFLITGSNEYMIYKFNINMNLVILDYNKRLNFFKIC